ncbi:S-methyl-5-thioribose-1-phosphate isomerase [Candidatus Acetothermia bacterium]|nr:S-methyl-5-thioribose-1-phosphate isomerase [Candidatus Acetothermia bacterium]MCI2427475.1 S-methyl-5-thioribose-1-phosphate isomerase [Candidatus Acetothermia bacterium]MCI2428646.1 S-methyl-5-thioribose-1-phosphate isomerase [Candidatus Acetothermia bacterium]
MKTLFWKENKLYLLDQRKLPHEITYVICGDHYAVATAISEMVVRGAPAIGVAAAYGIALAALQNQSSPEFLPALQGAGDDLIKTRPTAVNLRWAVKQMLVTAKEYATESKSVITTQLINKAEAIAAEDIKVNRLIGAHGAVLINDGACILTLCNAGALATAGYGTALGVISAAYTNQRKISVFACETRPYLQGARLTTWELSQAGIPVTLIVDNAAGLLFQRKMIDMVLVGADRIVSNGDVANKIGTYPLSILAEEHNVPFYVAAPLSTFDLTLSSREEIPIEERNSYEITHIAGVKITGDEIPVYNPAFDLTPAEKISAIITERGIIYRPDREKITALFAQDGEQDDE